MLLSAVSVLVVAQSSSEIPEGLMNNPVCELKNSAESSKQVAAVTKDWPNNLSGEPIGGGGNCAIQSNANIAPPHTQLMEVCEQKSSIIQHFYLPPPSLHHRTITMNTQSRYIGA